jgi:broad-specificity NMP kinase
MNEEIKQLPNIVDACLDDAILDEVRQNLNEKLNNVCKLAIKELEQEDVLDKIKTEIKEWYWQADKQALAKDPCVVDAMIDLFIRTIDKYKAESE